jgi:hypothetical protein
VLDSYREKLLALRANKRLHSAVQSRLAELLLEAFPSGVSASEISAVVGGRNDLIQYSFSGRRIVFEIFCSKSQVPQDLRLLEQCSAAVRIAVIIDRDLLSLMDRFGLKLEQFGDSQTRLERLWGGRANRKLH